MSSCWGGSIFLDPLGGLGITNIMIPYIRGTLGFYWDNGKENGKYHLGLRDLGLRNFRFGV